MSGLDFLKGLIALSKESWTVNNTPAVNTQATASKAARANARHVCTGITATLATGSAATTIVSVNLRDGASGAGNVLWTGVLSAPVNTSAPPIELSGLQIMGSVNTAMTLEFSGAGGATSQESVSLQGFDLTEG